MAVSVLVAWIGKTDLDASSGKSEVGLGPIAQVVKDGKFSHVYLLCNFDRKTAKSYQSWLEKHSSPSINIIFNKLSSPTQHDEIYEAVVSALSLIKKELKANDIDFTYHLSPGTPAMHAVWLLLAKTTHPATLIETSREQGSRIVNIPFDISAEFIPALTITDDELTKLTRGLPGISAKFDQIIHQSAVMRRVIAQARQLAIHDVPILIQGESGTGKELIAEAIHASSSRKNGRFIAVNCGAIPHELFESEFFGHTKGAFTGATTTKEGYLQQADGGTLFLDEVGEMPLSAQVKLLRSLQEGTIRKVGATNTEAVDFRLISATNRNLLEEVANTQFREDLFHRIAVGVLQIPPLRERRGDLNILIDYLLSQINENIEKRISGWKHKKLSSGARNLLLQHPWPGNVRELSNTLSRVVIWSGETISKEEIQLALITPTKKLFDGILNRELGANLNLSDLMSEVARHYLKRALEESRGNKSKAAELVGLPSYQTFSNWLDKYGIRK